MFNGLTPAAAALQSTQTSTTFTFSSLHPQSLPSNPSPSSLSPPITAKRPKRDFSNFRTPSGNYYCSACNLTLNSDQQMAQHIDSKKHRTNYSSNKKAVNIETGATVNAGPVEQSACWLVDSNDAWSWFVGLDDTWSW